MANIAILEGFLTQLLDFDYPSIPDIVIILPNENKKPPNKTDALWLESSFHPSAPERLSWGNGECKRYTGYFQVGVGYRPDNGELLAQDLAQAVSEHFPEGFTVGGVSVELSSIEAAVQNYEDSSQNFIPVRLYYNGITR